MKTLQEQYNLIKEGKGHKDIFLKTARLNFPQNITNYASFEEATTILKQKGIISENIGGLVTKGNTPDWHKIFNENIEEYALSNQELKSKSEITGKSIMYIYNLLSEIDDIDFIQEIGIIISRKDWSNRGEFSTKQKIYKEIQKHLDDKNIINDLENELYNQMKRSSSKLNEAKAIEKNPTKEVTDMETKGYDYKDKSKTDNVYGTLYLNGFYTEMNDPKNKDKSVDEVKDIVTKNLSKDRLFYVKKAQFGIKDIGYETEVPGLGTPKEATGKHKSSGYGDLNTETKPNKIKSSKTDLGEKEAKNTMPKKVDEMPITPKSLRGVKKMVNWGGKEKKIKLKESVMYNDSDGDKDFDMESYVKANDYYDKGLEAYHNGDKLKAEKYYQAALKAGSWLGWSEFDLPPYNSLKENHQYKENSAKWNSISSEKQEDLLLKYTDDAEKYIGVDWDLLPDYISANISRDEEFKNNKMQESKLRSLLHQLIKEELNMKEIDEVGKMAEYEAKSRKINEEIAKRRKKLKALTTLEEIESGSTNPKMVKELKNEIKKLEKIKEKLDKKYTPKEAILDEDTTIYTSDGTENTATSSQKNTAKVAGKKGDTVVYKKKGT